MTDNFKEIGSLFGREGSGAGFVKQTDKESFTYAFAWPEGDTWATLTGYLNFDEQPEEYVRRVLQDSPVALANSPNRDDVLLAILLATDAYDTPLIAGIKPDGTGNYGEREVETNMVLSVYSRQNFIRYFALLRDMNAFVFVSGRKIEALEDLSGLLLAGNCSGLDIDRILQRPKCLG